MSDVSPATGGLVEALSTAEEGLLACVHCGFCLPACPTYTRLGDENDSPRGRLYLMRAVGEGRLTADSDAYRTHIDRCLGCRACEPVCPSGVPYGRLLELARNEMNQASAPGGLTALLLRIFRSGQATRVFMTASRLLRASGLPLLALALLPEGPAFRRVRLGLAMLLASRPAFKVGGGAGPVEAGGDGRAAGARPGKSVGLLRGCVQQGLFARVNQATSRVLTANGLIERDVPAQGCCGALHAHGGELDAARKLARRNIEAFERSGVDEIVVNAAGCGATMKEYGHLLEDDPDFATRAADFAARVRDVSEVLAECGPRPGGPLDMRVAYDAPCHLVHAQGVASPPEAVLRAIPDLELVPLENSTECCGGAGIYGITHPELGGDIGGDKARAIERSGAQVAATGNPGCIMQIGAELRLGGLDVPVVHPVELLDTSYRRAGYYDASSTGSPISKTENAEPRE